MAARCAPRAMKVTSAPAFASAAPYPPPTPPVPTTAMRIGLCRHAMQRAELVAVRIAQIGDIELYAAAFADARRILAGGGAVGETGGGEGVGFGLRRRRKADGAAIGKRRGLAVDRLGHRESPGL